MLFFGLVAFLAQIQLIHVLRYNKTISVLLAALTSSIGPVMSYLFITLMAIMVFGLVALNSFSDMTEYSTLDQVSENVFVCYTKPIEYPENS